MAFTPKETVSFERQVGQLGMRHFHAPIEGPVRVTIDAVFEMPASWSGKKRLALDGFPHTQRPDLDNCMKAILDGLNRIAFADDSQVASMLLRKRWGTVARTEVTVEALRLVAPGGGLFA